MSVARLRALSLALTIGLGSSFGVLALEPGTALAGARPPACHYDDVVTSARYGNWATTLVDTTFALPRGYVPPGLVPVRRAGLSGGGAIRGIAVPDLKAMAAAARRAGAGLRVVSAYRSYEYQVGLFADEVARYGHDFAMHSVARPGHSEHQLGVTIDFGATREAGTLNQRFGKTAAGRWMRANSWKYGWILSYPSGQTSRTCYYSEPWHFRYVGKEMAARVHASGLTLREYIWSVEH